MKKQNLFQQICSYIELTKPRVNWLVLFTTAIGFLLAVEGAFSWTLLGHTLLGTALVASGACALNQCWEKKLDASMLRTKTRPLPEGRLSLTQAWSFSIIISLAGMVTLVHYVNSLSFILATLSLIIYIFIYTPFKKRSSICTLVGAISGAIPPMIGWAAVRGELNAGAWILFSILFFWQIPTFLSIAWIYRKDYVQAGFPMLTALDEKGGMTSSQVLLFTGGLFWVSLLPCALRMVQAPYLIGASLLGGAFFTVAYLFSRSVEAHDKYARKLFFSSILYLPLLLLLMVIDKVWL